MRGAAWLAGLGLSLAVLVSGPPAAGQGARPSEAERSPSPAGVPSLASLASASSSELRPIVERFVEDRGALYRRFDVSYSAVRRQRLRAFYQSWRDRLKEIEFDRLSPEGRLDYVLLDGYLRYQLSLLDRNEKLFAEMAPLLPFAGAVEGLQLTRRDRAPVDPEAAARKLAELPGVVARVRQATDAALREGHGRRPTPIVGMRAASATENLRRTLGGWYRFYSGYDPLFTWWAADPYRKADDSLRLYAKFLRERVVGWKDGQDEPIVGDPIGADGLKADLAHEMIPYTPKELVAVAEREFAWCEAEIKKAAREMGCGDDWKAALEKVKAQHVEPGKQTELIRRLAVEATEFVESRDLVTVPALAKEIWRIEMMSPERQRVTPFFTGGEVISVSYPTDAMAHEDKMMTMRGNNIPFSHATVFHEVIPGHHLQLFMSARYHPHRNLFSTPFYTEGWALYWEMRLWDLGFHRTPEERIGALFWRMHRAARIIFSLDVHLGRMTPQEAIDFLVQRVGHERANAAAEVRRSFNGSYPPLYQAGYMLGGLQLRALRREVVDAGKMTEREFHDAVLQSGEMPIEMVRARLLGLPLTRDYTAGWRFADRREQARRPAGSIRGELLAAPHHRPG